MLHQPARAAWWYAFREHFKGRMKSEAGARILLTEDVGGENALVSRLELVEL